MKKRLESLKEIKLAVLDMLDAIRQHSGADVDFLLDRLTSIDQEIAEEEAKQRNEPKPPQEP